MGSLSPGVLWVSNQESEAMKEEGWQPRQLASTLPSHPACPRPPCILISFCFFAFETRPHYVARTRFEPMVSQPQSPKSWDYKCASTRVAPLATFETCDSEPH